MEVLDTAALLIWPLEMLENGICASSQLSEVQRLSPARSLLIEAQGPIFEQPSATAIDLAKEISKETGDFSGLSEVDIEVLALALSGGHPLVTDDYRMQNVCQSINHPWRGVIQEGVKEVRNHVLVCTGCGEIQSEGKICPSCGSGLKLRRE
ncbi:MAG: hypothetical protein VYA86_01155 [Candidatus Thermoplasmatota archaeon]|nr:hypothetical protein [Candidatus Thermoplasmatota archaeon]